MKDWQQVLSTSDISIHQALNIIEKSQIQIILIVDKNRKILGTLTDGDIRRAIIKGLSIDIPISKIMNTSPLTATEDKDNTYILKLMRQRGVHFIPVVNNQNNITGLKSLDDIIHMTPCTNWGIIMAGGLGTRLHPLTKNCPKPLLKVGDKPVLETIIEMFQLAGFETLYIAVNYKSEQIKAYIGDGSRYNLSINYIEENQRLGTAGSLSLLPTKPMEPMVIMNGDIITRLNLRQLLQYHYEQEVNATMCVKKFGLEVPFGVVKTRNNRLVEISEKPLHSFLINGGIYVLEPECIEYIPKNSYFDMTSLFEKLSSDKKTIATYNLKEWWIDIGQRSDLIQAEKEFRTYME